MKKLKNKFIVANDFSRGKAFVKVHNSDNYFCINQNGEIIFSTKLEPHGNFNSCNQIFVRNQNLLSGVLDKNGKIIIECEWEYILDCSYKNYYELWRDNIVQFKDLSGKTIFSKNPPKTNNITPLIQKRSFPDTDTIAQEKDDKWGIINYMTNEVVIPFEYEFCSNFLYEGLASVKKNGKYVFVNKKNEQVIPTIYDRIALWGFQYGLCLVELDNKCGFIDKNNNFVIPLKYGSRSGEFIEGIACVEIEDGKYKYILPSGEDAF